MWLLLWKCRISSYPQYCSTPEPVEIDSYGEEAGTAIQRLRKPCLLIYRAARYSAVQYVKK